MDGTQFEVRPVTTETPERLRLIEIAEWLESGCAYKGMGGFDMRSYMDPYAECGTTCCIAGAALAFNRGARRVFAEDGDPVDQAGAILGLNFNEARALFHAFNCPRGSQYNTSQWHEFSEITPDWAARTIRHFLATGDVNWTLNRVEAFL